MITSFFKKNKDLKDQAQMIFGHFNFEVHQVLIKAVRSSTDRQLDNCRSLFDLYKLGLS